MTRTRNLQARTLQAKNPTDLLAMVPYVLGFHPEDSVVLLTLGDATNRFHARVDIPEQADDIDDLVEHLAGVAARNGVRRAVIVVYSDDECLAEAVATPLRERLDAGGVRIVETIRADGTRWFSLTGCTGPCCPAEGTPYDLSSHAFTAQSVLDGQVTMRSRRALRDSLIGGDLDDVEAVGGAADAAMARFKGAVQHPGGTESPEKARAHLVQEGHWVGHRVRQFLQDGVALAAEEVGRLAIAMIAIEIRDVAWAEMTHANAHRHVDLWRDVVRRTPLDLLAAPAALLGFAAWLSGDGALAWCAVERCQEAEPDYSLAGLLTSALAGAVPPSSWEPFDRELLTLFAG